MIVLRSRYFSLSLLLFALLFICSCAKPITSARMIPDHIGNDYQIHDGPLYNSIVVDQVGGGIRTDPMMWSQIGDPELREAIIRSLKENNYLANDNNGDYALNVFLIEVDQPHSGYTITITTFVKYKVIKKKGNHVIYDEIIDASDTKTVGDVFNGNTRDRIAKENSMKKNLAKFLEQLFHLNNKI